MNVLAAIGTISWIALWIFGPVFFLLILPLTLIILGYWWWVAVAWILYLPFYLDFLYPSKYKRESRLWEDFTRLPILHGLYTYLSMKFVYEDENDLKGKQYLFGVCPHGLAGFAGNAMINGYSGFRTKLNHLKLRYLTVTAIFWTPILREITMWLGGCDANRGTAEWLCKNGYSVVILPGGVEEQIHTTPEKYGLYLKGRKHAGIIRLALMYEVPLVPVFAFGPPKFFTPSKTFKPLMMFLYKYRIGIPIFSGWKGTLLPFPDSKLTIIVGKSLKFPKIENPTEEDIAKYQEQFIDAMKGLFDKYKGQYGEPKDTLEIN